MSVCHLKTNHCNACVVVFAGALLSNASAANPDLVPAPHPGAARWSISHWHRTVPGSPHQRRLSRHGGLRACEQEALPVCRSARAVSLDRFTARTGNTAGRDHIAVNVAGHQVSLQAITDVEYVLFHRRLRFSRDQVVASTFKVCIYDDSPRSS